MSELRTARKEATTDSRVGQSPTGTGSGFTVRLAPTVVATNLRSTAYKLGPSVLVSHWSQAPQNEENPEPKEERKAFDSR